jgi:hypothetical protein
MKTTTTILLLSTIGLLGCNSDNSAKYENKVPLTKEFLNHEWMLDSLYGSGKFIQDWVYFTLDDQFWRCSHYSENQLIDSSLVFKNNKVFDNGQLKYSVFSLDSNNIILVTTDNKVFRCRRWNEFEQDDIDRFINTNPTKKMLNGNWILDSSDITPTRMPSFCNELYPGAKYAFNPNGTFDIYPKDSTNKCHGYSYRIWENEIRVTEYDMVMTLGIVKLTKDKLILKSTYVSKESDRSEKMMKPRQEGYNLYLTR